VVEWRGWWCEGCEECCHCAAIGLGGDSFGGLLARRGCCRMWWRRTRGASSSAISAVPLTEEARVVLHWEDSGGQNLKAPARARRGGRGVRGVTVGDRGLGDCTARHCDGEGGASSAMPSAGGGGTARGSGRADLFKLPPGRAAAGSSGGGDNGGCGAGQRWLRTRCWTAQKTCVTVTVVAARGFLGALASDSLGASNLKLSKLFTKQSVSGSVRGGASEWSLVELLSAFLYSRSRRGVVTVERVRRTDCDSEGQTLPPAWWAGAEMWWGVAEEEVRWALAALRGAAQGERWRGVRPGECGEGEALQVVLMGAVRGGTEGEGGWSGWWWLGGRGSVMCGAGMRMAEGGRGVDDGGRWVTRTMTMTTTSSVGRSDIADMINVKDVEALCWAAWAGKAGMVESWGARMG
jgi:hypothetical protein